MEERMRRVGTRASAHVRCACAVWVRAFDRSYLLTFTCTSGNLSGSAASKFATPCVASSASSFSFALINPKGPRRQHRHRRQRRRRQRRQCRQRRHLRHLRHRQHRHEHNPTSRRVSFRLIWKGVGG